MNTTIRTAAERGLTWTHRTAFGCASAPSATPVPSAVRWRACCSVAPGSPPCRRDRGPRAGLVRHGGGVGTPDAAERRSPLLSTRPVRSGARVHRSGRAACTGRDPVARLSSPGSPWHRTRPTGSSGTAPEAPRQTLRRITQSVNGGPCGADPTRSPGRRGYASAAGTRALAPGGGCWAEKSACPWPRLSLLVASGPHAPPA